MSFVINISREKYKIHNLLPQLWVAYAPCGSQHKDAVQITLEQIDLIKRFIEQYGDTLQYVTSSAGTVQYRTVQYRAVQYREVLRSVLSIYVLIFP